MGFPLDQSKLQVTPLNSPFTLIPKKKEKKAAVPDIGLDVHGIQCIKIS